MFRLLYSMFRHIQFGPCVSPQNIHLVGRWLGALEKLLERCCEDIHPDYRVFMSAEPASSPQEHIIPQVEMLHMCNY